MHHQNPNTTSRLSQCSVNACLDLARQLIYCITASKQGDGYGFNLPCFQSGAVVLHEKLPQLGQQDALLTGHPLLELSSKSGVLANGASPE